jgi:hypothetical protein
VTENDRDRLRNVTEPVTGCGPRRCASCEEKRDERKTLGADERRPTSDL